MLVRGSGLSSWMWVSISDEIARGMYGIYTLNVPVGLLPVGSRCCWFRKLIMGGEFGATKPL